jgi:hypothetical protein
MFGEISVRDGFRRLDQVEHPVPKPGLHAVYEKQNGEQQDQHCWRDRHKSEQHAQANVQPRSSRPPASREYQLDDTAGDDKGERQQNHHIRVKQ